VFLTETESSAFSCSGVSNNTVGMWWQFDAAKDRKKCITATYSKSSSDLRILALYGGSKCNNLTCIFQKEKSDTLVAAWMTSPGQRYYLLGGSTGKDSQGDYLINITVRHLPCLYFCARLYEVLTICSIIVTGNRLYRQQ
jgi:hypothetical protein